MSDRITEIENRLNAATPGPWRVRECPPCTERGRLEVNIWDEPGNLLITDWCDDDEFHRPDAEFIANAPSDVAYLLAELRKRDEALARVEAVAVDLETRGNAIEAEGYNGSIYSNRAEGRSIGYLEGSRLIRAAVTGDGA